MKIKLILLLFFINSYVYSNPTFYTVKADNQIRVIQDGKEKFLKKGDLIQIGGINTWKREIKIISTMNPDLRNDDAHFGEKTYKQHLDSDRLIATNTNKKTVTKKISIIDGDGKTLTLWPGDEVIIKGADGWKRQIEVISSRDNVNGTAYIGDSTYKGYLGAEILKDTAQGISNPAKDVIKNFNTLDELIASLKEEDNDSKLSDEEIVMGIEVTETKPKCPKLNQAYKLDKSIFFLDRYGRGNSLPKESIIRVLKNGNSCEFELLQLPKGSSVSVSSYPSPMRTYPTNLSNDSIFEVQDPAKTIELTKGIEFRLGDGNKVNAIGRRTGKSYTFSDKDVVHIVGKHKNGDYIVKRNNEKWEYRVSSDDLDEMNSEGLLTVDVESTVNNIIKDDLITKESKSTEVEEIECPKEDYVVGKGLNISYQKCRTTPVKTSSGKTLKPNNFLEKKLPISKMQTDVILEDPEKNNFSKCISSSLRHGTNRNTNPKCSKDSNGNIKPQRIRQAQYVTRNGKKKFKSWSLLSRAPRACASKGLSTYLADRFVDMSRCLGIDPKELFPIINHESHFQPNTVSHTYAIGVGQIVTGNYADFYLKLNSAKGMMQRGSNAAEYAGKLDSREGYYNYENTPSSKKPIGRLSAYMMSELKDKMTGNKKECKGLRDIYNNPFEIPKWARASTSKLNSYIRERENQRVCMPKNPDEGFYMAAIYYMSNKKYFEYLIDKKMKKLGKKISAKKRDDFAKILARWSYNGGVAGMSAPFERLIEKIKLGDLENLNSKNEPLSSHKKISSIAELSNQEFKNYMSYVTKYRYPSKGESRRNEVAHYVTGRNGVGGIDGDLKQIEKGEVGSCGNQL